MLTKEQKEIRKKRESLNKKEDKIYEDRLKLCNSCCHLELITNYNGNSYDRDNDWTSTEVTCSDCGAYWIFTGHLFEKEIRKLLPKISFQVLSNMF